MTISRSFYLFGFAALLIGWPHPGGGETASPVASDADRPRLRDPFWPVGYVPKKIIKPQVVPTTPDTVKTVIPDSARLPLWDEARKSLDIRGISMIGRDKATGRSKNLAMIGGRLVEAGDVISVSYENRLYRWKVVEIDRTGVDLQKLDVRAAE